MEKLNSYLDSFIYSDIIQDDGSIEYLRAPGLIDVLDFGNMVSRIMRNITLPLDYWKAGTKLIVTPEYPDITSEAVATPMIVWDVVSRNHYPKEPVPRRRNANEFAEDEDSDTVKVHMVQRFENLFQFSCVEKDNYHASRLQEFLEDFLEVHKGLFQLAGIGRMEYAGRLSERIYPVGSGVRDKFAVRSTRYLIETQVVRIVPVTRLQEVEINLQAGFFIMLNERVTRGSGTYDTLSHEEVILIKQVVDSPLQLHSTYKKDADYYLQDNKIYWQTSGRSPAEGDTYFVTYLYSEKITVSETSEKFYE
jgi:hypothetical protein